MSKVNDRHACEADTTHTHPVSVFIKYMHIHMYTVHTYVVQALKHICICVHTCSQLTYTTHIFVYSQANFTPTATTTTTKKKARAKEEELEQDVTNKCAYTHRERDL